MQAMEANVGGGLACVSCEPGHHWDTANRYMYVLYDKLLIIRILNDNFLFILFCLYLFVVYLEETI